MDMRPTLVFLTLSATLALTAAHAQQRVDFERKKFDRSRFDRPGQTTTAPAATNAVPSLDAPPPAPAPTTLAATNAGPSLMTPPPAPALAAPVSTNAADRSNPLWKALEMPSTP